MNICLYGAASPQIDVAYIQAVEELGRLLVARGHTLVFGGGRHGLMGAAANGVKEQGGRVIGVIPRFFARRDVEVMFEHCDEVVETDTMRERKQLMEERADAFVVVPGGIGTFEEFLEILTLKQLGIHNKPVAVYNILGYYDTFITFLKEASQKGFMRDGCLELFCLSDQPQELLAYLEKPVGDLPRDLKHLKDG